MTKGLDLSVWQGSINLEEVKKTGYEFIILRASGTGYGDGVSMFKDSCFEGFYQACKNLNIPIGAYHYSCANTYEKGVAEAEFMYQNCLKGKKFEYPIYIDVEDQTWQAYNKEGVTQAIKGFCETLENKGYFVGVYANLYFFNNEIETSELERYTKWVACWDSTKPAFDYNGFAMWQYTNSASVAGYNVDANECYKDFPEVIINGGFNGYAKEEEPIPEPTPIPEPEPIPVPSDELPDEVLLDLVRKTIRGDFGVGDGRVEALGKNYQKVQDQVNKNIENGTTDWDNIKLY